MLIARPDRLGPRVGFVTGTWPLGMPSGGSFYARFARTVERSGFDLLFAGDHIFGHAANPDALAILAHYAATTERVTLGTAVLVAALREPLVSAKQLATIDYLSEGRLVVGVGLGGEVTQEWEAQGIDPRTRAARTDEYVELMRQFWSGRPISFQGRFRQVDGVTGSPVASRAQGPPIWIGGRSEPALRRAARHDGWCAYASSPRRMRADIDRLRSFRDGGGGDFRVSLVLFVTTGDDEARCRQTMARVLSGRYQRSFDAYIDSFCAVGSLDHIRERVEQYWDAGVDDILFCPQVPWQEIEEQVERLSPSVEWARAVTRQ